MKLCVGAFFRVALLSAFLFPLLACHRQANDFDAATIPAQVREFYLQKPRLELYRSAKTGEHPTDCQVLTDLANQSDFILQELATLRAHAVCADTHLVPTVDPKLLEQRPWLASIHAEQALHEAEIQKNNSLLLQASVEKAKIATRPREKLDWLQKALSLSGPATQPTTDDIQVRINHVAPRLIPHPAHSDWMQVGLDFLLSRDFDSARNYFDKIILVKESSADEKYMAYRYKRNSFKIEQNKEAYLKACRDLLNWVRPSGNIARIHEAFLALARAQWTGGQIESAAATLKQARAELTGKESLEELDWIFGRMEEEKGNYKKALEFFDVAAKSVHDGTLLHDRILFSQAWTLRKLGSFDLSAAKFQSMAEGTEDPVARNRYQFWQAMALQKAQKNDAANALLKSLTENDLLGYYGLLAYYKLGAPLPALQPQDGHQVAMPVVPSQDPNPARDLNFDQQKMIRALVLADEREVLEKFVLLGPLNLKPLAGKTSDNWLFVLQNLAEAGLYQPLFAQLASLPTSVKNLILQENPELIFPRRYLGLIAPAAKKFGVESEFVLSIIRQESSFDTFARSPADAFGLMQLLPSVAKAQEKQTSLHLSHHEDLYLPETNIPIGTALLSHLLKKYDGRLVLAAAAYNANEDSIASWIKTRLKDDPLEFIEDIPFEETRNYVKLVLRNYIFYNRLAQPHQALEFPKGCVEDLIKAKNSASLEPELRHQGIDFIL